MLLQPINQQRISNKTVMILDLIPLIFLYLFPLLTSKGGNQMNKFYGMSNDYVFKAVMQECEDVLRNLLCSLLRLSPEEITSTKIENPIILGESIEDKDCILDVKLTLNKTKNVNIELQIRKEDAWPERSLLYWSRMFDDIGAGEDYSLLKPTYHIGIINFPLREDSKELYSEYKVLNTKNHEVYTDKFCIKVLDLSQLSNSGDTPEDIVKWAKIFKAETMQELEELAGDMEVFKNMATEIRKLTEDEKIKQQMAARADYESRIATARGAGYREGREEGFTAGDQARAMTVYNNCLARGMSEEDAREISGLISEASHD